MRVQPVILYGRPSVRVCSVAAGTLAPEDAVVTSVPAAAVIVSPAG